MGSSPQLFFVKYDPNDERLDVSGPYESIHAWMRDYLGVQSLHELRATSRPVFVDRIPTRYPEVMVVRGTVVMPRSVSTVTEWTLE